MTKRLSKLNMVTAESEDADKSSSIVSFAASCSLFAKFL